MLTYLYLFTKQIILISKIIHGIKNYKYFILRCRVKYQIFIKYLNKFRQERQCSQRLEIAVSNKLPRYALVRNLQFFALDTQYVTAHCKILTTDHDQYRANNVFSVK
jgi:hypothetical protein